MNDSDFIKYFSPDLYQHYCRAKQVYNDAPELSLVCLRSYINDLCVLLSDNKVSTIKQKSLHDHIKNLLDDGCITRSVSDLLHNLRIDANKGAHPEQFKSITNDQFHELASFNLKKCCEITENIYLSVKNSAPPSYTFEEPLKDSIKELCYTAIMNTDPEAQYFVGLSLKSKAEWTSGGI